MIKYFVKIFNIETIQKPAELKEITILANIKAEAMEKAHEKAETYFPDTKIAISIQEIGRYI